MVHPEIRWQLQLATFTKVAEMKKSVYLGILVYNYQAVVVAHLVGQLLPTPEIRASNPVIGKFYSLSTVLQYWKDENIEKEVGIVPIFSKKMIMLLGGYTLRNPQK